MSSASRDRLELLRNLLRPRRFAMLLLGVLFLIQLAFEVTAPLVIRQFVDGVVGGAAGSELGMLAGLFLGLVVAGTVAGLVSTAGITSVAWRTGNELRHDLLARALAMDLSWHEQRSPGELLELVDADVSRVHTLFSDLIPQIVGGVLLACGVLTVLAWDDLRLAALLVGFLVLFVLVHRRDQQWAVPWWRRERAHADRVAAMVEEQTSALVDLHTAGATGWADAALDAELRHSGTTGYRAEVLTDVGWAVSQSVYAVATAAALALAAFLFRIDLLTIGTVFLVSRYLGMLYGPLTLIGDQIERLRKAAVSLDRIADLLASRSLLPGGATAALASGPASLELQAIHFGYVQSRPVLRGVDLSVAAGESVGLVGATGSGKSTIGRLLYRLADPDEGRILLDGVDLRDLVPGELSRRVAVVSQEVELFSGTVRDNVTLFRSASGDDRIGAVLEELGLGSWLAGLPGGLDEPIDPHRRVLSAGQAQLLAFARAYLKDPGLVVLDEVSAKLDPATEVLLTDALWRLVTGRTCLIVAHRPQTIRRVDRIAVMKNGTVEVRGPWQSLESEDADGLLRMLHAAGRAR